MRWVIVAIVGIASAGLMAVSVSMNFAFGSSFGRTALESYAYGAAFGFADILKVAAPIVVAKSFGNRKWGAAVVGLLVWGTFTVCSAVSAIGFASANRTFAVDTRTVQAALNQSRLASLEADQSELRRLRDRLASPELGRSERIQLGAAAQRLEAAIGATRGKLEDAAPVVSTANPQAHTLARLTGAGIDKVEVGLVLLVALLGGDGRVGTVRYHEPCEGSEDDEGSSGRQSMRAASADTAQRVIAHRTTRNVVIQRQLSVRTSSSRRDGEPSERPWKVPEPSRAARGRFHAGLD